MMKMKGGFTLIELMVTVALISILAGIAYPQFNLWVDNQRLSSSSMSVRSALMVARSTAVKKNVPVVVAFNTGGGGGYNVFVDNGDRVWADGEEVVDTGLMPSGISVDNAAFGGSASACFNPMGIPVEAGSVSLSSASTSKTQQVVLSAAGGVKIEAGT